MSPSVQVQQVSELISKTERSKDWDIAYPLLEVPADEGAFHSPEPARALPLLRPPIAVPATSVQLSSAAALAWGELSAVIWGDIEDLEASTERLTVKLRLASLMARRKGQKSKA